MHDPKRDSLVVIGSSAGGIEALRVLISSLPENFPAPVIVAQHLHPERTSNLAHIVESRSRLPVQPIEDQHDLVPGTIYIVQPNTHIVISDHAVKVADDNGPRPMPSIDLLFESAAEFFQENLFAVILSGTGSDGTAGVQAVKERNGVVIIENPQTAAFPAMALSVPPTLVDFVVDGEAIGSLLHDLVAGTYSIDTHSEEANLQRLLVEVQERSGIDFSSYKMPTITRRIQRRMVAVDCHDLGQYLEYLDNHPEEYDDLAQSFLIKVTEFFRDRELFDYLLHGEIKALLEQAAETGELRIWSAGCATGEEAYSLAVVIKEVLGSEDPEIKVRIFATDIDAEAIAYARRGVYPESALKNLPQEYIDRYFVDHGRLFEVRKSLRDLVVFGEHDLSLRSPFPHIDMVLCRNVLIYFDTQLQRRVLQLFAFALRESGYLILGKAESVSLLPDYFATQDSRLKVYRRQGGRVPIPSTHIPGSRSTSQVRVQSSDEYVRDLPRNTSPNTGDQESTVRRRIAMQSERALRTATAGAIIINRNYRIQYINPAARRHLDIHAIALGDDLMHVVQYADLTDLRSCIEQALQGRTPIAQTFWIEATSGDSDANQYIEYTCAPVTDEIAGNDIFIQTMDITEQYKARQALEETTERLNRQIAAYQNLEATNRRLTEINSRLHANNEELLISNEEFQAASEEVETLNEQLQATNEELETLNEELQATIEELNTTNDDLQIRGRDLEQLAAEREEQRRLSEAAHHQLRAVLASMETPVVLVDDQARIAVTNDAFDSWFGQDGGNLLPIGEDGNQLPRAEWPQQLGAAGESFTMRFAFTRDGKRWTVEAVGRPISDESSGGVIVFRHIDEG